jgi:hypothetical protein
VQSADHGDAAGDGGSGIAASVEMGDVVAHLLQADIVEPEFLILQPAQIAGEVIGVGGDGAGRSAEFGGQGIEPELGQPMVGPHTILLFRRSLPWHRLRTSCQKHQPRS